MTPAKLDILFAFTNYAGNGGIASTIPHLRRWWAKQFAELAKDERIGRIADLSESVVSNTPITMVRNKCLRKAIEDKFDILVFIDSDNCPDLYVGYEPHAKAFLQSSFNFLYKRLLAGVPTVIAAPYCGPPPHPITGTEENVYVFKWLSLTSDDPAFTGASLQAYDRDEAAMLRGIHPAAALPTGVCMIATKALECLPPPYFRYEWKDNWEDEKSSTEDVYFTRNICMAGARKYGQPVVFCNWDSWAGHYKQKMVGKPTVMRADNVCDVYAKAVLDGHESGDEIRYLGFNPDGTVANPQSLDDALSTVSASEELKKATGIDAHPRQVMVNGHPHWYIGWLTSGKDTQALLDCISPLADYGSFVGVEVGSWTGYTATLMLDKFPYLSMLCVDTFMGTDAAQDITGALRRIAGGLAGDPDIVHSLFQKNMNRFGARCAAMRMDSVEASKQFEDETLSFVFIDADHSYEGCKRDIEAWLPKVKPTGVICGHDYEEQFPGVKQAVSEIFGDAADVNSAVWSVDLAKVAMSPSKELPEFDDAPEDETHAIVANRIGSGVVECDETLVAGSDRAALGSMMRELFGRLGSEYRKLVYVGDPDPGTLSEMSCKGIVFCVCQESPRVDVARKALAGDEQVKFVRCQSLEDAVYEAWWDDGDADLVFVHEESASVDLLQRAMDLLKQDGILCGNGQINEEAFQGTPIGNYRETSLWGIMKAEYAKALNANGKAVH